MDWIKYVLTNQRDRDRLRLPLAVETSSATTGQISGREVHVFCSNDYLGLRTDPRLSRRAVEAVRTHGTGSGASRLVSGNLPLHERAEAQLAKLVEQPTALLTSSGYAANLGALASLIGPGDIVFSDALNHASIIDGCRLSRAQVVVYPHCDVPTLASLVRQHRPERRGWLVTESLFSMDGDVAPLVELRSLCDREQLHLYLDEAHAVGVVGDRGQGLAAGLGVSADVIVGTLGKALGGSGAFIAGSAELRLYLWNHCRSFVFSTGISPATAGAALEAAVIVADARDERQRLRHNIARLHAGLRAQGRVVNADPRSPIVPLILGDESRALAASRALLEQGYFVQAIRPPTVPEHTARLRIALSAAHSDAQIDGLLSAIEHSLS